MTDPSLSEQMRSISLFKPYVKSIDSTERNACCIGGLIIGDDERTSPVDVLVVRALYCRTNSSTSRMSAEAALHQ